MKDYVELRNGGYYIAGKRVSLDSLVYAFRDGESPECIRQSFSTLTLEEVYGGIAFYLANREEVDQLILQDEIAFENERRAQQAADPEWYARMDAARAEMLVSTK